MPDCNEYEQYKMTQLLLYKKKKKKKEKKMGMKTKKEK